VNYMEAGKTALVTGALGVLGQAIVEMFLEDGFRIVLVDLDQDKLNAYCKKFPSGKLLPVACDISKPAEVDVIATRIREKWESVDILVNNAGILSNNKALQTTPGEWRQVLAVNLDGAFYFARAFMEDMKSKRWGRIVNITSLAAKTGGITAGTAYSVSKGALIALTFSLAAELAPFGVTVNGIAPAYVRTPMVMSQLTKEQRQSVIKKIPVNRFCEAQEVAHTVRFLVHPLAGFITGEIIDQNGGLQFD
jgi:3-oxoacyl-[acyl-carrier protein] reductase